MKTKIKSLSLLLALMIFLSLTACGNTESEQDTNTDNFAVQNQTDEMETDLSNPESTGTSKNENCTTSDKPKQEQGYSSGKTKENISNSMSNEEKSPTVHEETKNMIDGLPGDSMNQNNENEWSDKNVDQDGWS